MITQQIQFQFDSKFFQKKISNFSNEGSFLSIFFFLLLLLLLIEFFPIEKDWIFQFNRENEFKRNEITVF